MVQLGKPVDSTVTSLFPGLSTQDSKTLCHLSLLTIITTL